MNIVSTIAKYALFLQIFTMYSSEMPFSGVQKRTTVQMPPCAYHPQGEFELRQQKLKREVKLLKYPNRLRALDITTLETRRLRVELLKVFKARLIRNDTLATVFRMSDF